MTKRALGYTIQLIFWGILVSAVIAIAIGVYSAVRQYSVGDYAFTGLSLSGDRDATVLVRAARDQRSSCSESRTWFNLEEPLFYFVGLHSPGQSGFNLDYVRHLVLPVLTLTVQIIGVVEPLPAGVDARRDERRLHPHRPGQGRAAAQGHLPARRCATR